MRENLLPRVLSIKIICLGFSHSREMGTKRSRRLQEEESFCENIQNLCTKPQRCIFCYTYTPHIYILHTQTHAPLGFNPLKKYESSSYWSIWGPGASWCVESVSCSEENAWKPGIWLEILLSCSFVPRCSSDTSMFHVSCWQTWRLLLQLNVHGGFLFWNHGYRGTAAMETSSIYVHR